MQWYKLLGAPITSYGKRSRFLRPRRPSSTALNEISVPNITHLTPLGARNAGIELYSRQALFRL